MSTRQDENPSAGAEVLDEYGAAAAIGVEVRTLRKWRQGGIGPSYLKLGPGRMSAVRYRRVDLERFLAASVVDPGQPA